MSGWMLAQWILLALVLPAVLYFFRFGRQGQAQRAYCLVLAAGYLWAFGQHLENCIYLYWPHEAAYRGALYLCYLGMCAVGPACVYLGWCYSGRHRLYRSRAMVGALFGIGAFFYIAILTNNWHHLYYTHFSLAGRGYSLLFYPFTLFSYVCFVYAFVVMQKTRLDGDAHVSPLYVLCFLPPVAANTVGMFVRNPALDFTPAAYALMVLGGYLIIWYNRPVSLVPVAAKTVVDSMTHPVFLRAPSGETLYHNGAKTPEGAVYRTVTTQLEDGNHLVMLTDITPYETLRQALETQAKQLVQAHHRQAQQARLLSRQAETAAQLAAGQQRMEIMARLDAEVRGKLEALRENAQSSYDGPDPQKLQAGVRLSSETLEIVRSIVRESQRRPEDGL